MLCKMIPLYFFFASFFLLTWIFVFGQQHESSIFIIRWFCSYSDQPFYIIHTISSRVDVETYEREEKRARALAKKGEKKERIIIVQSLGRRIRIHTYIHRDADTRVSHFSKILDPVHAYTITHINKMPSDRFAPYPLPSHISHNEYRKVKRDCK